MTVWSHSPNQTESDEERFRRVLRGLKPYENSRQPLVTVRMVLKTCAFLLAMAVVLSVVSFQYQVAEYEAAVAQESAAQY